MSETEPTRFLRIYWSCLQSFILALEYCENAQSLAASTTYAYLLARRCKIEASEETHGRVVDRYTSNGRGLGERH